MPSFHGTIGFRIIGAMKLATAALLAAAGFGVFRLLDSDVGQFLDHWVSRLHLDPENRLLHGAISQVAAIDHTQRMMIVAGSAFYAVLEFVEGAGLLARRHWAEYLTILATALLLPPELFEIYEKQNLLRVAVLIANLVVLIYLIVKVYQQARARAQHPVEPESGS